MTPRFKVNLAFGVGLLLIGSLVPTAKADVSNLTLTAAGAADGFTLSTVVDGFCPNGCGLGPLGNAVNSDGNIIVNSQGIVNTNYVFKDVDNQHLGDALSSTPFNAFPPAMATSHGSVWTSGGFSGPNAGQLIKLNNDGTINTVYSIPGLSITNGLWTNPVNGDLIGAGGHGLVDVNVSGVTPTFRSINGQGSDGVAVSPDGTTVYNTAVAGWDIATGALVSGPFPITAPDGMGVITSSNSLNGDIVVNSNDGEVFLIDPSTSIITIIANGGTRGDYTSPDPNGSLLLTQTDELMRLSCGQGCSIGGPPPTTPEPASLFLLGSGLVGLAGWKRRTQRKKA